MSDKFDDFLEGATPQQQTPILIRPEFTPTWIFSVPEETIVKSTAASLLDTYSARQAYVIARAWSERFEMIGDELKEKAIAGTDTLVAFDGKPVATIKDKALPKKYEYDDLTLAELERQAESLAEQIKNRKKLLQGLKAEGPDPRTGEIMKPAKLLAAGATISVTFL